MTKWEKIAKIIRTVTVPPVMVFLLFIILYFTNRTIFHNLPELLFSILFLMLIPIAAYPLSAVIPQYRIKGRESQRSLAFILSIIGYTAAVFFGFLAGAGVGLMRIYLTYFISAAVLTICNKLLQLRASGHACSITGPLILMVYYIGIRCVLPCTGLFMLIIWASIKLKRHTPKELTAGSASAAIAFSLSLLITYF